MEQLQISTHTPARGVTGQRVLPDIRKRISTHTPARGVTPFSIACLLIDLYFNPHSRKGSDMAVHHLYHGRCFISTHTPARGVTVKQTIFHLNIFLFFTQFTSFFHQTSPYFHFISFFTQNPGANLPVVLMSLLIRT